ncbi:hypothetical protein PROFUN_14390, partial [Planoprotostelium fungivorum]
THEKHKAHNNACLTTLWFSKQAVSMFSVDTKGNTKHKAHPHALISLCLYEAQATIFYLYKACSEHTKAYKCFANNLQTDHRKQALSVPIARPDLSIFTEDLPDYNEHLEANKLLVF